MCSLLLDAVCSSDPCQWMCCVLLDWHYVYRSRVVQRETTCLASQERLEFEYIKKCSKQPRWNASKIVREYMHRNCENQLKISGERAKKLLQIKLIAPFEQRAPTLFSSPKTFLSPSLCIYRLFTPGICAEPMLRGNFIYNTKNCAAMNAKSNTFFNLVPLLQLSDQRLA